MTRLSLGRRLTTIQRAILLLLGLFIATEATIIVLFHVYVLDPAATRFAEILVDARQSIIHRPATKSSGPQPNPHRTLHTSAPAPGRRPNNYFLRQTGRNVARMIGGGQMRISRSRGEQDGTIWIRGASSRAWIGFPVSYFDFGASNFVLLRLIVLAAFTFLGSVIIVREVNRPLSRLANLAHKWGKGDWIFDMEPIGGPDEIHRVEQAIRGMAADLRALYDEHAVLLTGISHELRTPLSRLLLVLHLPDHKLLLQKNAMLDDVAEMDETLRKFLSLVRNDSQERSTVGSLAPFLTDMAAIGQDRYGLDVAWASTELPPIEFKPLALERLVRNLFDNASRYGASLIRIDATVTPSDLIVDFRDNGPGIATATDVEVDVTTSENENDAPKGTGVGMLLCRRIATLHGGTIAFHNGPDGGLVVSLTIPRQRMRI